MEQEGKKPKPVLDKAISNILSHNAIPVQTFVNKPESISELELCHYNFDTISHLSCFPSLVSLCIVAQDISEISGLDEAPNLERLWICETKVSLIQGLDTLKSLKSLYLYMNRITKIQGLESLSQLEHLCLNDNEIQVLENLEPLKHLKTLQIANNKIRTLGHALNENMELRELNISGNLICSFREIIYLVHLTNLKHLSLSDPNFADNPICALCNYQTHVVYHLPHLETLDTLEVKDESRKIINATIMKKRMYYNMRIATLRRNTDVLEQVLVKSDQEQKEFIEDQMLEIHSKMKLLEKHRDDLLMIQEPVPESISVVRQKLEQAVGSLRDRLDNKNKHYADIRNQITNQSDMAIRKLLLELETGGNVRVEDEQQGDAWVADCEKLVKLFIKRSTTSEVTRTIQIHRISRFHNRHMKMRFEQANAKMDTMHLCFNGRQSKSDDVFSVVEHGYVTKNNQPVDGVLLSNFLDCGDEDSFTKTMRQAVIVKVGFVNQIELNPQKFANVEHQDFPSADAVYMVHKTKGQECPLSYIAFNNCVMLPEYFIEYSIESEWDQLTTPLEKLLVDIAYSNRLSHSEMPSIVQELSQKLPKKEREQEDLVQKIELQFPVLVKASEKQYYKEWDMLHPRVDTFLNLTGTKLPQLLQVSLYINLKRFSASNMDLTEFPDLTSCFSLLELDLSFNNISTLKYLDQMHLNHLDLTSNQIQHLYNLDPLRETQIKSASFRFNPVSHKRGYRYFLAIHAPALQILDGILITGPRKQRDWHTLAEKRYTTENYLLRPLSMRTSAGYGHSSMEIGFMNFVSPHNYIQTANITTLELDGCRLFSLDVLPLEMPNLKWASFRDNYLVDIKRVVHYKNLQELNLEKNNIVHAECLTQLEHLAKLNLSNNQIEKLEWSPSFKSLMLLSIERNRIKSLRPISRIATLMELYIAGNDITELFAIFPLKELTRLIILDLTGNQVCQIPSYRLFTMFHLSRLKILNGSGITPKEQSQAREEFMGRLTIELLGEKIGHFTFKNITELDLRNCKIREVDCLAGGDFRNLRKLNFDNNLLVNIDCFVSLTGLRYLSINHNKIERLLSTDIPVSANNGFFTEQPDAPKPNLFLSQLEELHMGHNNVSRIADLGLYRMPRLRILFLQGNRITKIDGLEQMTGLLELGLDKNQIRGADPLSFLSLINLKALHLKENRLRSLSHFDCMPNLQMLFLANNRIHELSEIEKMKLPSLLELSLASNSVCRKQLYRIAIAIRFPQILAIDGREVSEEERQKAHAYCLEQYLVREDTKKIVNTGLHGQNVMQQQAQKGSVKISSVVLDGLEMKLGSNKFGRDP
ncbi:hypothetical protein EDD86DRAFT_201175, partial [Gorgonomyces haynaldii]